MLDIVRPTFASLSFDGSNGDVNCTLPASDGEALSCLWSDVASDLSDQDSKIPAPELMGKLQTVYLSSRHQSLKLSQVSSVGVLKRS